MFKRIRSYVKRAALYIHMQYSYFALIGCEVKKKKIALNGCDNRQAQVAYKKLRREEAAIKI